MSFPTDFLLCRQDPAHPGFGLEDFESGFAEGEPIFSDLTEVEANEKLSKMLETSGAVFSAAAGAAGVAALAFPPAAGLSAVLAGASGILTLAGNLQSKNEISATDALTSKFEKLNSNMDEIALDVAQGFLDVRKDIADNELDDLMGYLQSIHHAYQDMVNASLTDNTSEGIKEAYVENYRAVCNHPFFTPLDLFRQFYGFSCGDNKNRDCTTNNGDNTGKCKYGVKKRQYIRDIYEGITKGLSSRYIPFGTWLLQAMVLAQFHFESCLPRDGRSCDDPMADPVRRNNANEMTLAMEEVEFNLNHTLNCINQKFRDTLSDKIFYQTKVPGLSDCLNNGNTKDEDKNICMAGKVRTILEKEFPSKHWAVVVYNKDDGGDPERHVEKVCAEEFEYGCINLKVDEIEHRFFHLMYRETRKGRKNYLRSPEFPFYIPVPGSMPVLTESENDVFKGHRDGLAVYGVVKGCTGDPLKPTDDPKFHIFRLGTEHGYIAIETGKGTRVGVTADPVFRIEKVNYTSFKNDIFSTSTEFADAWLKCDMPALQKDFLGSCTNDCGVLNIVA